MIKNERQYRITKAQAEKLHTALAQLNRSRGSVTVHPVLRKAQADALRSQLADLHAEMNEYESLRAGKRTTLELASLEDLPRALIQARIAAGLSQKELAGRLGLKEQQIQRYEVTNYASASLARVQLIAQAIGLRVQADAFLA